MPCMAACFGWAPGHSVRRIMGSGIHNSAAETEQDEGEAFRVTMPTIRRGAPLDAIRLFEVGAGVWRIIREGLNLE